MGISTTFPLNRTNAKCFPTTAMESGKRTRGRGGRGVGAPDTGMDERGGRAPRLLGTLLDWEGEHPLLCWAPCWAPVSQIESREPLLLIQGQLRDPPVPNNSLKALGKTEMGRGHPPSPISSKGAPPLLVSREASALSAQIQPPLLRRNWSLLVPKMWVGLKGNTKLKKDRHQHPPVRGTCSRRRSNHHKRQEQQRPWKLNEHPKCVLLTSTCGGNHNSFLSGWANPAPLHMLKLLKPHVSNML